MYWRNFSHKKIEKMLLKKRLLLLLLIHVFFESNAQTSFRDASSQLPNTSFKTWLQKGAADMNNDGRDDIVRANQAGEFFILTQNADGTFTENPLGQIQDRTPLSVILADLDNDNYTDILTGGQYNGVRVVLNPFRSPQILRLPQDSVFTQASAIFDINNDGLLDIFVCNDDSLNAVWRNGGNGTFIRDNMGFDFSSVASTKHSGNYGIVFTDFDNDGSTDAYLSKCRAGVEDSTDQRRINQLFKSFIVNGGAKTYSDIAPEYGMADGRQSWVTEFQDIDNDGDMDAFIANHHAPSRLMENDGTGHFTDITHLAGLGNLPDGLLQVLLRDFDNDGYVDLLCAGMIDAAYYRNNGNQTFSPIALPLLNPSSTEKLRSFVVGDFNQDGFQDIYSSTYWGGNHPDRLWLNETKGNHYLAIRLIGTVSNRSSVGAKLTLTVGGKTQIREVRAGESYGISNSLTQYFGIGSATQIESLEVRWPSGQKIVLQSPTIDQLHTLIEPSTNCTVPIPCVPIMYKILKP